MIIVILMNLAMTVIIKSFDIMAMYDLIIKSFAPVILVKLEFGHDKCHHQRIIIKIIIIKPEFLCNLVHIHWYIQCKEKSHDEW
jgi:hypothetical protein